MKTQASNGESLVEKLEDELADIEDVQRKHLPQDQRNYLNSVTKASVNVEELMFAFMLIEADIFRLRPTLLALSAPPIDYVEGTSVDSDDKDVFDPTSLMTSNN